MVVGKWLVPNIARRSGHSNYDIAANCFLTVVKLAASSHYHAAVDRGRSRYAISLAQRKSSGASIVPARAFWPQGQEGKPTMPEYYFHLLEESNQNLVRDSDGITLSDAAEARKEAIGLARDIVDHGLHKPTWQVVVTDANAVVVFAVPLSGIHPR